MKKSLSVLLALALVISMFSTMVSAAEDLTTQQKYDALAKEGIFSGHANGEAGLDENMTRAQAAVVVAKVLQLDVANAPAVASFKDVKADHWAFPYVEAAVATGYINGNGDGTFTPNTDVTLEQLATILSLAASDILGVEIPEGKEVAGKTSWGTDYVAFALANNLIPTAADYTVPAKRSQLVEAIYAAQDKLVQLAVASYKVIDRQTVEFAFNDGSSVKVELEEKLQANKETAITFTHQDQEFTATVKWEVKQGIASFEAVGAKKFEVVLSNEIDKDNTTITLKKGSAPVSIKEIKYDGSTAIIETNVNLNKGTYTVTVKYKEEDVELTESVDVEDQKISGIEILGENAPIDRGLNGDAKVFAWIKVSNQYGEDITASQSGQLTLTASKGQATYASGKVTIEGPAGSKFVLNEQISLSVLHSSGAFATQVLAVSGPAKVASLEVVELKHATKENQAPTGGDKAADYSLVVEAVDQYGNKMDNEKHIAEDVLVSSSNPYVATVKYDAQGRPDFVKANNKVSLAIASGVANSDKLNQGKTTISFLPAITGNRTNFEIEVAQKIVLDTLTISAPDYVVAGDKVELPFTAVDQFGNEITKASVLNSTETGVVGSGLQLSSGFGASVPALKFEQDPVSNKPVLTLDLSNVAAVANPTPVYINGFTANQKQIQTSLTVQPNAKPQAIANADKTAKAIAQGAKTEIKAGDLKVVDQYGRTKSLSDFTNKGFSVDVKTSNAGNVAVSGAVLNNATTEITLTSGAKGSAEITLTLKDNNVSPVKEVDVYSFTVQTVDKSSIASYEVANVGSVYANNAGTHAKEVKVTGKLSNGTVVALPDAHENYYEVVDATYNIQYNKATKKIQAKAEAVTGTNAEKTYQLVVITYTDNASQTHTQDIVVSNVKPVATKLEVQKNDTSNVKKVNDGYVTIKKANLTSEQVLANAAVKVTDQYGETLSGAISKATASEFSGDNKTVASVAVGESFTLTVVTDNGKTFSFKVGVTN